MFFFSVLEAHSENSSFSRRNQVRKQSRRPSMAKSSPRSWRPLRREASFNARRLPGLNVWNQAGPKNYNYRWYTDWNHRGSVYFVQENCGNEQFGDWWGGSEGAGSERACVLGGKQLHLLLPHLMISDDLIRQSARKQMLSRCLNSVSWACAVPDYLCWAFKFATLMTPLPLAAREADLSRHQPGRI